jgi:hypothetical protein
MKLRTVRLTGHEGWRADMRNFEPKNLVGREFGRPGTWMRGEELSN